MVHKMGIFVVKWTIYHITKVCRINSRQVIKFSVFVKIQQMKIYIYQYQVRIRIISRLLIVLVVLLFCSWIRLYVVLLEWEKTNQRPRTLKQPLGPPEFPPPLGILSPAMEHCTGLDRLLRTT